MSDNHLDQLRRRLAEVSDLEKAASLLSWDQQTMMPPGGVAARAEQLATLRMIAHERLASAELGKLLDALADREQSLPPDSDDASLIRVARADHEKARRVPAALRAEMTRAGSLTRSHWLEARARADFELLRPHLERNVELCRRYADCFDTHASPYDALLDIYEAGRPGAEIQGIFDTLKTELRPLIATVLDRGQPIEHGFLHGHFPAEAQRAAAMSLLELLGFDPASWRLDPTAHPFAMSGAPTDIRITTRFDSRHLTESLFMAMHEFGHGLYEHQVSRALWRTPLGRGVSLGVHESQSRLWENLVGRSRGLWRMLLPRLRAAYPQQLAQVELEDIYRAINRVELSPIRARADEATYNLHIILRFELERELFDGSLAVRDLPEAWNAAMDDYLGVRVPDASQGVLQDVHWAAGLFGYFPTYALGNVMSAQLWERALEQIPTLGEQLGAEEIAALRDWLGERLHRHGRKLSPRETLERAVGSDLDPGPYLAYLRSKFGEIYGLELEPAAV